MIIVVMGVCGCGKTTVGEALAKQLGWHFADADEFHSIENKNKMGQGLPLNDQDRIPWLASIHEHMKRLILDDKSGVVTCSALKVFYRDILRYGAPNERNPSHESDDRNNIKQISGTASHESDNPNNIKQTSGAEDNFRCSKKLEDDSNLNEESSKAKARNINKEPEVSQKSRDKLLEGLQVVFVHLAGSRELLQERMEKRQGHFMPPALLQSQLDTLERLTMQEDGITVNVAESPEEIIANIVKTWKLM